MRRVLIISLLAVSAVLAAMPAVSAAATREPTISRVTPMRVSVGNLLTIRGTNFKARARRNTVIFRGAEGRTAFAKPRSATTRKLVLRVPASVARLLRVVESRQRPTRLKLRVLSGKFSKFTPRRLSPVVTGVGDGDGTGPGGGGQVVCDSSNDHDGDLLANSLELAVGTDPCIMDTDNDQMSDGWEYWSAKDLNIKAVPYPGKRPFPNALDPSDGGAAGARFSAYDFDGDGLTTLEEYRAWRYTGSDLNMSRVSVGLESALGYSDGTKFSRASEVPAVPDWRSANFGLANPSQPFPSTYDLNLDPGVYQDDERDADRDGLANWLEAVRGPGQESWWPGYFQQDSIQIKAWAEEGYSCDGTHQRPGAYEQRPFESLDLAERDVDGDSLLDGEDDQDNDDFSNIVELYETEYDLDGNGAGGVNPVWCAAWGAGVVPSIDRGGVDWAVNAFNPCAPSMSSRSCPTRIPFG